MEETKKPEKTQKKHSLIASIKQCFQHVFPGKKPTLDNSLNRYRLTSEDKANGSIMDENNHARKQFIAKISHDMRSPLNGIIGFAEIMYHGKVGEVSVAHKEYLGDILTCARQLLLLINDVIDLTKIESGKMDFHPETIDPPKVLEETRRVFETLIDTKKIKVIIEVDPAIHKITIDPNRFKQIVYNFVSNALKCTPVGGQVTIRILPHDNDQFILQVEDNGIGIHEEDLKRLFVEFQQLDPVIAQKYPSSGLGLALTKHIVEALGGQVGVVSTYGKGSTFSATLPLIAKS